MPDFDDRAYCDAADEYRLSDDGLRRVADTPGRWMAPLAREALALRARVAGLEAETKREHDSADMFAKVAQHLGRLCSEAARLIGADPGDDESLLPRLRSVLAAHERLKRETQEDYVRISAKQDRDARRIAVLEQQLAEARRIHHEAPGECYHCPRCQDADESNREADRA